MQCSCFPSELGCASTVAGTQQLHAGAAAQCVAPRLLSQQQWPTALQFALPNGSAVQTAHKSLYNPAQTGTELLAVAVNAVNTAGSNDTFCFHVLLHCSYYHPSTPRPTWAWCMSHVGLLPSPWLPCRTARGTCAGYQAPCPGQLTED